MHYILPSRQIICNSVVEAEDTILGGRIRAGDMVGIRYEGRLELHASADQGAIIKM